MAAEYAVRAAAAYFAAIHNQAAPLGVDQGEYLDRLIGVLQHVAVILNTDDHTEFLRVGPALRNASAVQRATSSHRCS